MKPEAQLERLFRRLVREAGGIAEKLAPTHVGMPDRMVIWPGGRIELAELKTETGRLSPAQVVWHARAAALGCHVAVLQGEAQIRSWVAARDVLVVPALVDEPGTAALRAAGAIEPGQAWMPAARQVTCRHGRTRCACLPNYGNPTE